jgi:hypothetical protein
VAVAEALVFDDPVPAGGTAWLPLDPGDPDALPPEGRLMPTPEAAWATARWIGPGRSPLAASPPVAAVAAMAAAPSERVMVATDIPRTVLRRHREMNAVGGSARSAPVVAAWRAAAAAAAMWRRAASSAGGAT